MEKKAFDFRVLNFSALNSFLLRLIVFSVIMLSACENPYVIHNLARQVTATGIEFHTDKDMPDDPPYPLKPVFAETIYNYTVYVHESAERIYPAGYPEDGASVVYEDGSYINENDEEIPVPFDAGGYAFPPAATKMKVSFRVSKEYRLDGPYTVEVVRRADPGRLRDLRVSVAYFDTTIGVDKADPGDPGWIYETDNYMINFDPSGLSYKVTIPYYAEKVLINPELDPGIKTSYTLYPRNPEYYPDDFFHIKFEDAANPPASPTIQYFDFVESKGPPSSSYPIFEPPYLYVEEAIKDTSSDQKTSYLTVHTVVEDADSGERRYPQDYQLTLVWDKSYAYLKDLDLRDDYDPAAKRILGNFFMGNTDYTAETASGATEITLTATPRDGGSTVKYQQYDAIGGETVCVEKPDFNNVVFSAQSTAVKITVENIGLGLETITYWVDIRKAKDFTKLSNLRIEGYVKQGASSVWKDLFFYDNDNNGSGPDFLKSDWSTLKEPGSTPFDITDTVNYTLEIDGAAVSRLRIKGWPESGGTVQYIVEEGEPVVLNDGPENTGVEFDFSGGTGASITASRQDYTDRVYAFTFIRIGAQIVELYTDTRDPPANGDPIAIYPSTKNDLSINNSDRGTFQALVGVEINEVTSSPPVGTLTSSGKAVNNALPQQTVCLQIRPKLGWAFDKLLFIKEDGSVIEEFTDKIKYDYSQYKQTPIYEDMYSPEIKFCSFKMPETAVRLLVIYKHATGSVSRAAYVAPEGKANRSGAYGTDALGTINIDPARNNTGTSWAYATSNLQGVIDAFDGVNFDEIWLLEGTYRLDPNTVINASGAKTYRFDSAEDPAKMDWAEDIVNGGSPPDDELSRAFVLKQGVRLYGGFKGTEGDSDPLKLQESREMRGSPDPMKTVLSGVLQDGSNVRHVVIAAGIAPPDNDTPSDRAALDTQAGYDFDPSDSAKYPHLAPGTNNGVFGGAGVTLLDGLTIQDGLRTKDNTEITVNGLPVAHRYGAGLYCVNSSPYLNNVRIYGNTSVMGGGMYNTATGTGISAPVLNNVTFSLNDVTGYDEQRGNGAGFANGGGGTLCMPVFLDCTFTGNATVGGNGAGLYVQGGKVLIRRSVFRSNIAALQGGGLANSGETWVYDSDFANNNAYDGGSAISQGGNLYLVNVTVHDNVSTAIVNGGTLSGTNLTVKNNPGGIVGGSLALVNSRLTSNGTAVSGFGSAVLTNVIIDGNHSTGIGFGVASTKQDDTGDNDYDLGACILNNVTIIGGGTTGTGISASYGSSFTFHHGAANLLMNSVRISGFATGVSLSQSSTYPDGKKGLYVTMNNVTLAGNTTGLTTSTGNIAAPAGDRDVLDLRIRNSVIMGNANTITVNEWPVIGTFASGGNLLAGTLSLSPQKAALLNEGDTFRVLNGTNPRPALYTVHSVDPVTGEIEFTPVYPGIAANAGNTDYAAGNTIALSSWTSIGAIGNAQSGNLNNIDAIRTLKVNSAQKALLPRYTLFKISDDPRNGASGTLVCQVTWVDPVKNEIQFKVMGPSGESQPYTETSHIMISSKRPALGPLGSRLKIGTNNTWNLSLSPAQSALLKPGATFRIASGGETGLSEYTVEDNNGSGEIRFSASSRDAYAAADKIALVSNGDLPLSTSFTLDTVSSNFITVTAAQAAKLAIDDKFKLLTTGGILRDSTNKVISIDYTDPLQPIVEFEADVADTIDPSDTIMVVTDISIGEGNLAQPGNLSDGVLHIDPALAALMLQDEKFKVQKADGTLSPVLRVSSPPSNGTVSFTGGSGTYTRDDYIVFPVNYADLKGTVSWDHSMAQGVDKAVNQPDPAFYSASGLTADDVFTGTRYSPKTSGPLDNTGDSDLYPVYAADLETQCFERFEAYVDPSPPPALAGIKDAINTLLVSRLYTWSGNPSTGALSGPGNIADFLARDNGSNKGDLRDTSIPSYLVYPSKPRKSGLNIDMGAYEN